MIEPNLSKNQKDMLRPQKPNYKDKDIVFQIIDWRCYDIIDESVKNEQGDDDDGGEDRKYINSKKTMIRGYGITEEGHSISVHIDGFEPYFFFSLPEGWDNKKFLQLKTAVLNTVPSYQKDNLIKAGIVSKKEFYGFTNNELFKYGVFKLKNQNAYYAFLRIFRDGNITIKDPKTKKEETVDFSKRLYETKVTPLLRFFHVKNINPSGWMKIENKKYKKNVPVLTRKQVDISFHYDSIEAILDKNDIGKMIIASFDIECSSDDGSFPSFMRKNDPIIQIGTTVTIAGSNDCQLKYIGTVNQSHKIEGTIVENYKSEKHLILGWADFIANLDPDILTGYNIWGFDWEYIFKRAETGNAGQVKPYHFLLFDKLQCLKKEFLNKMVKKELTIQDLSSSALGVNILKYIDIEGVVQIDLLKVVQRDHKLDSYKLDNVAKHFMGQQKVDLSPQKIFENFKIGTPDKITEIAVYCIMDCKLVNDLINKLQVIPNNLGMSNVCVVPFSFLFLRGQGIKIFSLVAKFCREENFLIKDLSSDDIDTNSYEGAIVFIPKPGIYFEPIVVMDFNSLYPSSMIAENISHDSIVGYKEYALTERGEYEMIKNTINEKYDNLPEYHYNDIEYDVFKGMDDDKKKVGYKVCRFAEANSMEKSVLPRILRTLLKARKDTRKIMEYETAECANGTSVSGLKSEEGEKYVFTDVRTNEKKNIRKADVTRIFKSNNEFQLSVLDGLQAAYKVTCNSLYGQVGAATSSICYKELAACTTAIGRRMVTTARDLTLTTFCGAKLTYGDSVSGDTPVLLRAPNGLIYIKEIASLGDESNEKEWNSYEEFKPWDVTNRREKQQIHSDSLIWTSKGWSKIHRVIRHKTKKRMFRIRTELGEVDVTEDHSLLSKDMKIVKPSECKLGAELLHGWPLEKDGDGPTIMNAPLHKRIAYIRERIREGRLSKDASKVQKQELYFLLKSIEKETNIDVEKVLKYTFGIHLKLTSATNKIVQIIELPAVDMNTFVYDIETETGNFQAGVGQLIVKNTDSIFVNFADEIRRRNPGREMTEQDLLRESIKIGEEAARNINSHMKSPQNIEYEKTFWPFCIFSKKRYFGNKYEHSMEKYKQTSMGIVLKRRDNAPIVKKIYGGVIDILLNKRNIEDSKKYFYDSVKDLLNGSVDIKELVVSKTVKTDYSNPNQIAHKVLADRMGERDAGNKPQSNDRIPYCYIETGNLKCKVCCGKVNPDKCKCITCMSLFCANHLYNHRKICTRMCRFCKVSENVVLQDCRTCKGCYCDPCFKKHVTRKDKYKILHNDKCKKELTTKLLQGDTIEHPLYIAENNLKIDFYYYLTNQIQKPVFQIFELVMNQPEKIIEDLVRRRNNLKNGNRTIGEWLKIGNPKVGPNLSIESLITEIKKITLDGVADAEEDDFLRDIFEDVETDKNFEEE